MYQEHTMQSALQLCITTFWVIVSGILTKNIAGASGIELPILFASIESIDTFVSIGDFDTMSIVSPIPNLDAITFARFITNADVYSKKKQYFNQCCQRNNS